MAIVVKFSVSGATIAKYEEVLKRLSAVGSVIPPGQLYHVAYGSRENLQVINVYESQQALDAFAKTLLPILAELGITAQPEVQEVYKIMTR